MTQDEIRSDAEWIKDRCLEACGLAGATMPADYVIALAENVRRCYLDRHGIIEEEPESR